MNIDWFTFAAQIVNFLVLVALLHRFLYGPISRAMAEREQKIANRLQEAANEKRAAEEKAEQFDEKLRELHGQRDELLVEARQAADSERRQGLRQAQLEVERKRREWHESFQRERRDIIAELRRFAGEAGIEAARHALTELADEALEESMFNRFMARLERLEGEERATMQDHLVASEAAITIRSAFEAPAPWRERLKNALQEKFAYHREIAFETARDLICGVELDADGYAFGWNVGEFLHELEEEFDKRIKIGPQSPKENNQSAKEAL